jgi:hypothetical protein
MTTLTKNQVRNLSRNFVDERGREYTIEVEVRHDDQCGNGHNTFAITGMVFRGKPHRDKYGILRSEPVRCGCIHDEVAEHFPELKPLLKWHLCSTDGPIHYFDNTIYLAGDRDCWGLRKFERINGRLGEGKERELDAARRSAIWPEATDEELMADDLRGRLEDRLPALLAEFKAAVEGFGFTF